MLGKSPFDVELEGSGAPINVDMVEAKLEWGSKGVCVLRRQ